MREATGIIEDDLLSTVAEALTSLQHVDSCNRGFTSLRGQFCPLLTKEIKSQGCCRMVLLQSGFLEQGAEKGREEVEKDWVRCRSYFICICSQDSSQANIHLQN